MRVFERDIEIARRARQLDPKAFTSSSGLSAERKRALYFRRRRAERHAQGLVLQQERDPRLTPKESRS